MPDHSSHLQVFIHQLSRRRSQNPFRKNKGLVQCVSFHPVRPYFFVATQRSVRIYNLVKQEMTKKLQANSKWISSMAVHPGGNQNHTFHINYFATEPGPCLLQNWVHFRTRSTFQQNIYRDIYIKMFWRHFCTVGRRKDAAAIFIYFSNKIRMICQCTGDIAAEGSLIRLCL